MSSPMATGCAKTAVAADVAAVLRAEATAILEAADRLDPAPLTAAVDLFQKCRGKIVVSGVGKSGMVARRIAAAFNSTGAPSVFLHAADAGHGDLGLVQSGDVALIVSHGGESDEIISLLPHLRSREVPVVALVGNALSSLARSAAIVIHVPVDQEACPLNLAPTASAAAAQAIGDGLAVSLMKARGLNVEDFARNHPSGRLGRRLTLRVRDLIRGEEHHPRVVPTDAWSTVLSMMCRHAQGAVNVLDESQRLVGIITDGDIRRTVERVSADRLGSLTAQDIMTPDPITVVEDCLAVDVLSVMENRESQISVVPVLQGSSGACVGLLRLHDILRSGVG